MPRASGVGSNTGAGGQIRAAEGMMLQFDGSPHVDREWAHHVVVFVFDWSRHHRPTPQAESLGRLPSNLDTLSIHSRTSSSGEVGQVIKTCHDL